MKIRFTVFLFHDHKKGSKLRIQSSEMAYHCHYFCGSASQPWVVLQFVIVVFSDHTYLLFFKFYVTIVSFFKIHNVQLNFVSVQSTF